MGNNKIQIGRFLVSIDAMKDYQVEDILERQQEGDSRLFGEIAIDRKYINDEALRKYVVYMHPYSEEEIQQIEKLSKK